MAVFEHIRTFVCGLRTDEEGVYTVKDLKIQPDMRKKFLWRTWTGEYTDMITRTSNEVKRFAPFHSCIYVASRNRVISSLQVNLEVVSLVYLM